MNKVEYKHLIAFHPGYYIKDMIEDMEISQEEFANRLGVSGKTVSKLINGKINLSNDVALQLSTMFGTSTEMWLNLQQSYNVKCLEIAKEKQLDSEKELLKLIDYKYFVDLGFVENTRDTLEKIKNLCAFFKISKLSILLREDLLVNYRSSSESLNEKNIVNSKAWLQTAINIGKDMQVESFNESKLEKYIPEIREMTLQNPDVFLPRLKEIFSECGVSFVLLPHLKNSGINGAVKWINNEKVILAMNDRRNYADTFWFSLFHEIKHVLQQKHKLTLISFQSKRINQIDKVLEEEADLFAQDTLIPRNKYKTFIEMQNFSESSICSFSKCISIHPGIVVGRLQNDKYIGFNQYNNLKLKYKINLS
mgnify:CR=1 FL=1